MRKEKKAKEPLTLAARKKKRKIKKMIKIVSILVVLSVTGIVVYHNVIKKEADASVKTNYTVVNVERRNITTVLSSSGSIAPLNIYNITTLVKGEIIAADFEAGSTVKEDDVLYQLTTDDVDETIKNAQKAVERAQSSYDKAVSNHKKALDSYEEAVSKQEDAQETYDEKLAKYEAAKNEYKDLYELSSDTGIISNIYVEAGQSINKNSKIVDIYDDSVMLLTVPFHSEDVSTSWVGKEAKIQLSGSFETLNGKVTKISNSDTVLAGNQIVRNVTIEVENPGGITVNSLASATISRIDCYEEGKFTYGLETTITSTKAGEIDQILIEQGGNVKKGAKILSFTNDSVENALSSYTNAVDQAENSLNSAKKEVENAQSSISNAEDSISDTLSTLEDAKDALEDAKDSLTDCQITSPVTGIVVNKNTLVGDIIGTSNMNNTLATIYDVSSVTFTMDIDELDIKSVQVGQKVNVTADALENEKFEGVVTSVSLESTSSGGVTQYPITVQINDVGDLLVGMNVTGEIVLSGVENVLSVPVEALKRGNTLYVKDDSVTEENGNIPAGFKAVTVETGLSDGDYIEITSGISEGDQIYVARNTSESTGMNMNDIFGGNGKNQRPSGQGFPGGNSSGNRPSGNNGSSGGFSGGMPNKN